MYCVKCGVELEKGVEKCPLCNTPVPYVENLEYEEDIFYESEYPEININIYELKMRKVKKAVFIAFFTISIISILEIFFQNIIIYGISKHHICMFNYINVVKFSKQTVFNEFVY